MSTIGRCLRSEGYDERDLYEYADGHFQSCLLLFGAGFVHYDSAAYLGHLSIELFLKMHLLHARDSFPRTHDLRLLLREAQEANPQFCLDEAELIFLDQLSKLGPTRYPLPDGGPNVGFGDPQVLIAVWRRLKNLCSDVLVAKLQTPPEWAQEDWVTKGGRVLMERPSDDDTDAG